MMLEAMAICSHIFEEFHAKLKEAHIYCGSFLGGIRVDPAFYNTYEELDRLLALVRSHVKTNLKRKYTG